MSASQFDLGMRLRAHALGKPVARTATKRFALERDAMLLAVLASPGDHAGIWGAAWAQASGRPTSATVNDPRARAGAATLWNEIGRSWAPWLAGLASHGRAPQFVVADDAVTARVALSARDAVRDPALTPAGASAARAFLVAEHLSRLEGQQVIAAMTDLLCEHYVSGRDPLDERHLGLWTSLPTLRPGWDAPQVALPPGADDPDAPLGRAWDRLRAHLKDNNWVWTETAQALAQSVSAEVLRIVKPRWGTLQAAVRLYQRHPGAEIPLAAQRRAEERYEFGRFETSGTLPSTRSQQARWRTLARREEAQEVWREALWTYDQLERARGVASGDVLVGNARRGVVTTSQPVVRVRPGDRLVCESGLRVTVLDLGTSAEGLTVVTDVDDLEGEVVAWAAAVTIRQPVPSEVPWTHDERAPVPSSMPLPAGDLLERVRSLRSG